MTLRLDFCDFSPNFDKYDCWYCRVLRERFDVRLCDQPDFLIYGPYGHEHLLHSGVRIFVSGEPVFPDFTQCDYSIGCLKLEDPCHLQLPSYVTYGDPGLLVKKHDDPERIFAAKSKFCSFVVGNQHPTKNKNRADFFRRLSRYRRVDSGGRFLNNVGGPIPGGSAGKTEFLRSYKFNIAFENTSLPGYTTEKIFESMVARCLPIYWGNPQVGEEFNTRSFLNHADFPDAEALIEKIIGLDRNDAKYLEYLRQPYFSNDEPNRFFSHKRILDFFESILATPIEPVGRRRKWFHLGRWRLVKRHHLRSAPAPTITLTS